LNLLYWYQPYYSANQDHPEKEKIMPANPTSLLPVPYISQLGPGADLHNNDCGAASGAMILQAYTGISLTPDVFYDKAHPSGDVYLGVGEIQQVLSVNSVGTTWKTNQSLGNLFMALTENKPPIVLFKYSFLSDANLTESKFKGAHFAVVVGMDLKTIYLHDPLYQGTGGEAKAYPLDKFLDAWVGVSQDPSFPNPACGALTPTIEIGQQIPGAIADVKTTANLNVRTGPGTNFSIVQSLPKGTSIKIYTITGNWGQINASSERWVSLAYTTYNP
jgi:uncharacterized protein YvpB